MHTFKSLSILAIAGSALAAPLGDYWIHGDDGRAVVTATATATSYTTVTAAASFYQQPATTAAPTTTAAATPAAASPFFFQPQENSYQPPAASSTQAASKPASSSTSSSSGDSGYMAVVNTWRANMGLSQLTESSTLVANAQKTVDDDQGDMKHELNSGSMAQVLAPGDQNNFENVFVGGWLCEEPNLSGMNGICQTMSAGWNYEGQIDHAQILRSTSYSKIGCAFAVGLWGCDLA